ncbi:MAG: hypothetical protein RMJ17_02520 [Candidatus Aenigmarchaeota archaeon]|nr:hypothetical protein [Candidatus Aenigmarchaeota archaeon]MDW8149446.1 hypothetical protein [Candidatus Aenigmarchaeota archaeon]
MKLKVGFFSLTCDEGCSVNVLEVLNNKYFEWKNYLEFVNFRLIKSENEIKEMDIAFVEGVVSTKKDLEKIKKIREKTKKLIALGTCAISGPPSNLRNNFNEEKKREIKEILEKFGFLEKCFTLKEVVKVDGEIPGCPIDENKFIQLIENLIKNARRY